MDKGRKIDVSASTLVDLKAELFRKQEQLKQSKLKNDTFRSTSKFNLKSKETDVQSNKIGKPKPDGECKAQVNEVFVDDEVTEALEASRKKLEEKARLYDKLLSKCGVTDDSDEIYMVDFQRKHHNESLEKQKQQNDLSKESKTVSSDDESDVSVIYPAKEDAEEWVDYTDALGRSRRCLKKDLPSMIEMDADLKRSSPTNQFRPFVEEDDDDDDFIGPIPLNDQVLQQPLGPLHYQNIKDNEIRNHGVGYYAFSQSEEERQKQMDLLNSLRNQTQEQRVRREKLKSTRQKALKARLEMVKQRKKLKLGEVLSDDAKSDDDFTNFEEPPKAEELSKVEVVEEIKIAEPVNEEPKPVKIRPWDKGKIGVPRMTQPFKKASQKEWIEERRNERPAEFAPPQSYQVRDHVEEMHEFFKQTWRDTLASQGNASSSCNQSDSSLFMNDIPLPPSRPL